MTKRSFILSLLFLGARAALGETNALRLVFFTDVHTRTEWNTPAALEKAAAAINAQNPDLIIGGGDFITDGFQSSAENVEPRWKAFLAMSSTFHAPFVLTIGNHDLVGAIPDDGSKPADDPRASFRAKLGVDRTYRSFDTNGYHFILLDSIDVVGGDLKYIGRVGPEQVEWVKKDLAAVDPKTPIVVATHLPLMTVFFQAEGGATNAAPANRVVTNSREVLDLFKDRNLVLVLQGHTHALEMAKWRNTTFLTGGSICGQWWRGPWRGTEEGFCVVALRGSEVDWKYIDYGWDAARPAGQ